MMKISKWMMAGCAALALSAPLHAQANVAESDSCYLFAFFSNNSPYGEQIRYALSDDGFNYSSFGFRN